LTASGAVQCDEVEAIDEASYVLQALQNSLWCRDDMGS